jgi:hypothetical protein
MYVFLSITLNEIGRKNDQRYIRIRGITDGGKTGERCTSLLVSKHVFPDKIISHLLNISSFEKEKFMTRYIAFKLPSE